MENDYLNFVKKNLKTLNNQEEISEKDRKKDIDLIKESIFDIKKSIQETKPKEIKYQIKESLKKFKDKIQKQKNKIICRHRRNTIIDSNKFKKGKHLKKINLSITRKQSPTIEDFSSSFCNIDNIKSAQLNSQQKISKSYYMQESIINDFDLNPHQCSIQIWFNYNNEWKKFNYDFHLKLLIIDMKYQVIDILNQSYFKDDPIQVFDYYFKMCDYDDLDFEELQNLFQVDEDTFLVQNQEVDYILIPKTELDKQYEINNFNKNLRTQEVSYSKYKQILDPNNQKEIFQVFTQTPEIKLKQKYYQQDLQNTVKDLLFDIIKQIDGSINNLILYETFPNPKNPEYYENIELSMKIKLEDVISKKIIIGYQLIYDIPKPPEILLIQKSTLIENEKSLILQNQIKIQKNLNCTYPINYDAEIQIWNEFYPISIQIDDIYFKFNYKKIWHKFFLSNNFIPIYDIIKIKEKLNQISIITYTVQGQNIYITIKSEKIREIKKQIQKHPLNQNIIIKQFYLFQFKILPGIILMNQQLLLILLFNLYFFQELQKDFGISKFDFPLSDNQQEISINDTQTTVSILLREVQFISNKDENVLFRITNTNIKNVNKIQDSQNQIKTTQKSQSENIQQQDQQNQNEEDQDINEDKNYQQENQSHQQYQNYPKQHQNYNNYKNYPKYPIHNSSQIRYPNYGRNLSDDLKQQYQQTIQQNQLTPVLIRVSQQLRNGQIYFHFSIPQLFGGKLYFNDFQSKGFSLVIEKCNIIISLNKKEQSIEINIKSNNEEFSLKEQYNLQIENNIYFLQSNELKYQNMFVYPYEYNNIELMNFNEDYSKQTIFKEFIFQNINDNKIINEINNDDIYEIQGSFKQQNNGIIIQEKLQILIPNIQINSKIENTLTFILKSKFQFENTFQLFQIVEQEQGLFSLTINAKKVNNNLQIEFELKNPKFEQNYIIDLNYTNSDIIKISVIILDDQVKGILLNNDKELKFQEIKNNNYFKAENISVQFLHKNNQIKNSEINYLLILNSFLPLVMNDKNCSLKIGQDKCYFCKNSVRLENYQCDFKCPFNWQNSNGICKQCENDDCKDQQFLKLDFERISNQQINLNFKQDVVFNNGENANNYFNVKFNDQDLLDFQFLPNNKGLKINLKTEQKLIDQTITININPQIELYSKDLNYLKFEEQKFELKIIRKYQNTTRIIYFSKILILIFLCSIILHVLSLYITNKQIAQKYFLKRWLDFTHFIILLPLYLFIDVQMPDDYQQLLQSLWSYFISFPKNEILQMNDNKYYNQSQHYNLYQMQFDSDLSTAYFYMMLFAGIMITYYILLFLYNIASLFNLRKKNLLEELKNIFEFSGIVSALILTFPYILFFLIQEYQKKQILDMNLIQILSLVYLVFLSLYLFISTYLFMENRIPRLKSKLMLLTQGLKQNGNIFETLKILSSILTIIILNQKYFATTYQILSMIIIEILILFFLIKNQPFFEKCEFIQQLLLQLSQLIFLGILMSIQVNNYNSIMDKIIFIQIVCQIMFNFIVPLIRVIFVIITYEKKVQIFYTDEELSIKGQNPYRRVDQINKNQFQDENDEEIMKDQSDPSELNNSTYFQIIQKQKLYINQQSF